MQIKKSYTVTKIKIPIVCIKLLLLLINFISITYFINTINVYENDDVTLVSCYIKTDTKRHSFSRYRERIKNLFKLNKKIIFFIEPSLRESFNLFIEKKNENKVLFINITVKELDSYKKYLNKFNKLKYLVQKGKWYSSIETSIIWAEKITFLKKVVDKNYFNSKCFYWIDADLFQETNLNLFQNKSSHSNKCLEDERVFFFTYCSSYQKRWRKFLLMFKNHTIPPKKFFVSHIIWAGFFGGQKKMIIELYKIYYKVLEEFYKNSIYLGCEENIYSYISVHYPNVIKVIKNKRFSYIRELIT